MAGLVGSIEAYNPKSDDWSNFKGWLEFYFQIKKITYAAMKWAAILTIINIQDFVCLKIYISLQSLLMWRRTRLSRTLTRRMAERFQKWHRVFALARCLNTRVKTSTSSIAELLHAFMKRGIGDQFDNRVKDQFVIGLRTDHIKNKLFEDEDKDLGDILKRTRALKLVDRENSSSKSSLHAGSQHVQTSRLTQPNELQAPERKRKRCAEFEQFVLGSVRSL